MNKDENEPYSKKIKIEDHDKYIQTVIDNLNAIAERLDKEPELEDHGYN